MQLLVNVTETKIFTARGGGILVKGVEGVWDKDCSGRRSTRSIERSDEVGNKNVLREGSRGGENKT